MKHVLVPLLAVALAAFCGSAAAQPAPRPGEAPVVRSPARAPSSEQLEKSLQELNWNQFKSVVSAIPKLKADVDAYGPMGWQYVKTNYKTYRWRKNIDKLSATQKGDLAKLIADVKRKPAG